MNQDVVVSLTMDAMSLALKVALPMLLVGLVVGLIISVFQAITQIQEQTLSFIPKVLAMIAVIAIARPVDARPARGLHPGPVAGHPADGRPVNELLRQFSEEQVAGFFLVLARVTPLFVVAPLFSSRMIPPRVRGIAAVGLTLGIAPLATKGQSVPLEVWELGGLVAKELLVGLAFAFAISVLFAAITVAGSFTDTLIGFSFGSLVDPITGTQSSVLQQAYSLVGVMVFIVIGGDAWVIQGLNRTYELVPLLDAPALGTMVAGVQAAFSQIFTAAVELAAPVMLAILITDAAFGVVAKVVPQLNVFQVGFPAKVTVGLLIIGVSLPFAAGWIADELQRSVGAALSSLRVA